MNLNEMATIVSSKEKGSEQVSIAQIKEIIKITGVVMYENPELVEKMLSSGKRNSK